MKKFKNKIDRPFLFTALALIIFGFFIFISASMGLLARDGFNISSLILNQLVFGLILGGAAAFFASRINYKHWKKMSLWLFIIALVMTGLVFVPGIGVELNGAKRWIALGPLSFQPAEFLKIAYVLYVATWLSNIKQHIQTVRWGIVPLGIISAIIAIILLLQPDTDTFLVALVAAGAMFFVAGGKWKHILSIVLLAAILLGFLVMQRPYLKDRFMTFLNPAADPLDSGYQIQQSLIAIGSGGIAGRGFGQSVQKFNFLPEPINDSIFAVAAEEFGFIGSLILILLFLFFMIRGYKISSRIEDSFGRIVFVGFVTLITFQSIMNIGSMLGIIPLSGLPLIFVSKGGTSLLFTLFALGILFNISRYQKD